MRLPWLVACTSCFPRSSQDSDLFERKEDSRSVPCLFIPLMPTAGGAEPAGGQKGETQCGPPTWAITCCLLSECEQEAQVQVGMEPGRAAMECGCLKPWLSHWANGSPQEPIVLGATFDF